MTPDDREVRLAHEERSGPVAEDGMVVDHDDAYRRSRSANRDLGSLGHERGSSQSSTTSVP